MLVESIPNFSEGRNFPVLNLIKAELSYGSTKLLHTDIGHDANRTVFTIAGEIDDVLESLFRAIKTATHHLDMRQHIGEHPRIGLCDVCPIVPLIKEANSQQLLLKKVAQFGLRLGSELGIPVFLYEQSAIATHKKNLAEIRKGEYENLEDKMLDSMWHSDNNASFNAKTGATVLGVRDFLIAYNINLNTKEEKIAKQIAAMIRQSANSPFTLKGIKAIGWYMEAFDCAQVSTNIVDIDSQNLTSVWHGVTRAAQSLGYEATGAELIGLIPEKCLLDSQHYAEKLFYKPISYTNLIDVLNLDFKEPFYWKDRVIEHLLF